MGAQACHSFRGPQGPVAGWRRTIPLFPEASRRKVSGGLPGSPSPELGPQGPPSAWLYPPHRGLSLHRALSSLLPGRWQLQACFSSAGLVPRGPLGARNVWSQRKPGGNAR